VTYWRLYYHLVWATRQREPSIDDLRAETIKRSIRLLAQESHALTHAIGVMPDHVHVAISVPPKIAIADFVHQVKGASSRLINIAHSEDNIQIF
jgi:REP element-mobilizing transposase RayT